MENADRPHKKKVRPYSRFDLKYCLVALIFFAVMYFLIVKSAIFLGQESIPRWLRWFNG